MVHMIYFITVTRDIDERKVEKDKKKFQSFVQKKLILKSIQRGLPGTRIQFKPCSCLTAREFGLRDFRHKSFEGQFTC